MFKRIGISIGHIGKPNKPFDCGAATTVKDSKGNSINMFENMIALEYGTKLYIELIKKNKETFLICDGEYRDRLSRANGLNLDLILHCHVNTGGGNYTLTEHSYLAGSKTKETAQTLADNLGHSLGVHKKVVVLGPEDRGYNILEPVKASSIILEPFFLDSSRFKDWIRYNTAFIKVIVNTIVKSII